MKTGRELIAEVDACNLMAGSGAAWWLGQHSFIVKLGSSTLYLDPFLSAHPRRNTPPLLRPDELANAAMILGTHDHSDHIDRPVWPDIAAAAPEAPFLVPEFSRLELAEALQIPPDRFIGMNDGTDVEIDGIRIAGVAAAHEFLDRDEETGNYPFLGYVIEGHGLTIYHAGDTCVYEGMHAKLRQWHFDLAMLPINGRDAQRLSRGCIGCMTFQEAADLAGAVQPGLTVPAHFDMFDGNTEDPEQFTDYVAVKYPGLATWLPNHGECRFFGAT